MSEELTPAEEQETTESTDTATDTATASDASEAAEAMARRIRHIGYVLFGGSALLIAIILGHTAISGCYHNQVWDPFTGEQIDLESDSK